MPDGWEGLTRSAPSASADSPLVNAPRSRPQPLQPPNSNQHSRNSVSASCCNATFESVALAGNRVPASASILSLQSCCCWSATCCMRRFSCDLAVGVNTAVCACSLIPTNSRCLQSVSGLIAASGSANGGFSPAAPAFQRTRSIISSSFGADDETEVRSTALLSSLHLICSDFTNFLTIVVCLLCRRACCVREPTV